MEKRRPVRVETRWAGWAGSRVPTSVVRRRATSPVLRTDQWPVPSEHLKICFVSLLVSFFMQILFDFSYPGS